MTVGVNNLYNTDISAEILRLKKIFLLLFLQTLNEYLISLRFLWINLRRKKKPGEINYKALSCSCHFDTGEKINGL